LQELRSVKKKTKIWLTSALSAFAERVRLNPVKASGDTGTAFPRTTQGRTNSHKTNSRLSRLAGGKGGINRATKRKLEKKEQKRKIKRTIDDPHSSVTSAMQLDVGCQMHLLVPC
jgi:hypothetical protein